VTADELNEFQQKLERGEMLTAKQCAGLVAEIWRLKTVIAGKTMEAQSARSEAHEAQLQLETAGNDNAELRRDVTELREIHGLPSCALENRWSNCAVRMRKRSLKKVEDTP
jgi:hypothetical protein